MIEAKSWGTTECIFKGNGVSVHLLHIKPGGYCSVHRHAHRSSEFVVVRGELSIRLRQPFCEENELNMVLDESPFAPSKGGWLIPPGIWHQFRNESDLECIAIETYYSTMDEADIERIEGTAMPEVKA